MSSAHASDANTVSHEICFVDHSSYASDQRNRRVLQLPQAHPEGISRARETIENVKDRGQPCRRSEQAEQQKHT
jgi:hypothetical protein